MTIKDIFDWAWKNGLDMRLESINYYEPLQTGVRFYPREREAPNYIETNQTVVEHPVIIFSRGNKHIKVTARNWFEMGKQLEYKHKHIFSELMCKLFGEE